MLGPQPRMCNVACKTVKWIVDTRQIDKVMWWLAQGETHAEKSISPLTFSVTLSCWFALETKDLLVVEHDRRLLLQIILSLLNDEPQLHAKHRASFPYQPVPVALFLMLPPQHTTA